jgi:hypothetical protein
MTKADLKALSDDTAVSGGDGRYTADVGLRWDNRGRPVGAILAGSMARAASLEAGMATVVSTTTQFLYPVQVGSVEISCAIARRSSALCCVNTVVAQADRTVCQGTTWLSSASGQQSYATASPEVPDWTELLTADERLGPGVMTFSGVLEQRPLVWEDDFEHRPETAPYRLAWVRFPPGSAGRDPVTMACEALVVGDLYPPLTMMSASPRHGLLPLGAQTLELSARMGSFDDDSENLLVATSCESMSDLMLTGLVRVWSENRALRGEVSATYRLPRPLISPG